MPSVGREYTGTTNGVQVPGSPVARQSAKMGAVNSPVTPWVLAGRILSIIGMAFCAAVAILLFIIPEWTLGLIAAAGFFPFFGLIVLVERFQSKHGMIGPESGTDGDPE